MTEAHQFAAECKAIAHVDNESGVLCCYRLANHPGLHWDKTDGLSWTTDEPFDEDFAREAHRG